MAFTNKKLEETFDTYFVPFIRKTINLYKETNTFNDRVEFINFIHDIFFAKFSILEAGKQYFEFVHSLTSNKEQINELLKLFTNSVPVFEFAQTNLATENERKIWEDIWEQLIGSLFKIYDYTSFMDALASKCNKKDYEKTRSKSASPIFSKADESQMKSFAKVGGLAAFLKDEEDNSDDNEEEIEFERFDSDKHDLNSIIKNHIKNRVNVSSILGLTWTIDESADELLSQLPSKEDIVQIIKNSWSNPDNPLRNADIIPAGVVIVIAPKNWEPTEEFTQLACKEILNKLEENEGEFFIATLFDSGEAIDLESIVRDSDTKCTNPFYDQNLGK